MRKTRFAALLATVACCATVGQTVLAGPAAADPPVTTSAKAGDAAGDDWTPYRTAPFQLAAGVRCPFGLAGTPVRDRERIRTLARFPDGTPLVQEITGPLVVRYTNTDTGATVRRNLTGRATITYREDGSFTETLDRGRFAFGLAGSDPGGPGFFGVRGSGFTLTVRTDGSRTISLRTGRVENLCTTLAAAS